jgi:glycosyltransferase involved in cell wall biosynthesis
LEYVALHIPVIAARTPGIMSYFDEDMVHFFSPGDVNALADAIIYLFENTARRQQLVQASNRFNEQYAWETIARQYFSLIESLLGAKSPAI